MLITVINESGASIHFQYVSLHQTRNEKTEFIVYKIELCEFNQELKLVFSMK